MPEHKMGPMEWLLLIILSILWGGSFFFAEVALEELQPVLIVFARVGLGALALLVYIHLVGYRLPTDLGTWAALFVMGALNNAIPFMLIVWGQVYIESGLASILNATTPLFTVFVAHFLTTDERLSRNKIGGIVLGLVGVVFLIGPEMLAGLGLRGLGSLAILGAALSYAFASVFGRRLRNLPTSVAATGMLIGSTAIIGIAVIALQTTLPSSLQFSTWGALLGISLFCTAWAYLIYFRILSTAGATNLMLVTFLIPPSALFLGIVFLNELLTTSALIGMLFIFAGLALVDGRLLKFVKS